MAAWFPEGPEVVFQHKQELGCLLRFSKQPSVQDALPRWEDGLYRIDRLVHQNWNVGRKIQVIRQGVFPQLFSGCETFHISLSTFKKFRAKLNVAVHGKKTRGSHFLSPLFTHGMDYEPFLYVFRTRLASLRSTVLSFTTPVWDTWNYAAHLDLNANYHKVLGPVSAFIWGCQVLGRQCLQDLVVVVRDDLHLHLLHTPLEEWYHYIRQSWIQVALSKCNFAREWPDIWAPLKTWTSLWSGKDAPGPLSMKFRTLGLLTSSATAAMQNVEEAKCEFCDGQHAGQKHIAMECLVFQDLRDEPQAAPCKDAPPFTRCTGIPCRMEGPRLSPQCTREYSQPWTGEAFVFTDGSAAPPEQPQARLSSWSVVAARQKLGQLHNIMSGITPGQLHDICRAETFAVLQAITKFQQATIFCDNLSVVLMWQKIKMGRIDAFKMRSHPNVDLWTQIISLLVAKGPNCFHVQKVKAHRPHSEAQGLEDSWQITGNARADLLAKRALGDARRNYHLEAAYGDPWIRMH